MKKVLLLTLACMGLNAASALTLTGQIVGAPPEGDLLIGVWTVEPSGERGELLGAAPLGADGRWSLSLSAAPSRPATLNAATLAWSGVLPPVTLSEPAQAAEARAYAFADTNKNGMHDAAEPLREVALGKAGANAFVAWVSAPVSVSASKGYKADLAAGWNLLGVRLGKAVEVQPLTGPLELRIRP